MKKIIASLLGMILTVLLVACTLEGQGFKVYFVTNGGSSIQTHTVTGETFAASELANFETTKTGFDFVSWHTHGSLSDETIASGSYNDDVTFYAKWQEKGSEITSYIVTFNSNGGSSVSSQTVLEGGVAILPDAPKRAGHIFLEWQLNDETFDFDTILTASITLVAKWEIVEDSEYPDGLVKLDKFKSINEYQLDRKNTQTFFLSGLPTTGEFDVLVIPVELKNHPFESTYFNTLDTVFNGTSEQTGWESVSSFYEKSSFGQLKLNFDISAKYTTAQNSGYYEDIEDDQYGEYYGDEYLTKETLDAVDQYIDFTKYDYNNDNVIDAVIFVYSIDYYQYEHDLWWAWVYTNENEHKYDNKEFGYYMWVGYHFQEEQLGDVLYNAETYIHELGHLFGLDDYYPYEGEYDYGYLGSFDMMDHNAGDHGPLNKLILGWIEPLFVEEKGNYQVNLDSYALYEQGLDQVLIIPNNANSFDQVYGYSEYLVVMYYKPTGLYEGHLNEKQWYDLPDESGLVIYHVNAKTKTSEQTYWEIFEYNNELNSSNTFIKILEADKNNSLNGNNALKVSDLLTSGTLNLSTYRWHDNSAINVTITVNDLGNTVASINVSVN